MDAVNLLNFEPRVQQGRAAAVAVTAFQIAVKHWMGVFLA